MNRVGFVFLLCVAAAVAVSLAAGAKTHPDAIQLGKLRFATTPRFNAAAAVISAILIGLYWYWW